MRILGRHFVIPFLVKVYNGPNWIGGTYYSDRLESVFYFIIRPASRMGGTTRTTTYQFEIKVGKWQTMITFCRRPDVTHYYLFRNKKV